MYDSLFGADVRMLWFLVTLTRCVGLACLSSVPLLGSVKVGVCTFESLPHALLFMRLCDLRSVWYVCCVFVTVLKEIQQYVTELSETSGEVLISYYLTSIYDHSALEAFSKVAQSLSICRFICSPVFR